MVTEKNVVTAADKSHSTEIQVLKTLQHVPIHLIHQICTMRLLVLC